MRFWTKNGGKKTQKRTKTNNYKQKKAKTNHNWVKMEAILTSYSGYCRFDMLWSRAATAAN